MRVGQVISYHIPVGDHHVQSHRVIEVVRGGGQPLVRTKGDANTAPDPWTARLNGSTAWQVRAVVPKAGWAIVWLRSRPSGEWPSSACRCCSRSSGCSGSGELPATARQERPPMRRRAPLRSSELRRRSAGARCSGSALAAFVVASVSLAGLSSLASGGPQTFVTKRIFPGPRSLAAQDVRDASSGAETNKSDAFSYADAVVTPTSTAIASGTNLYWTSR